MNWYDHQSFWIVWISLFIAIILQIMPVPSYCFLFRPSLIQLLLIYWSIEIPHRVNIGTGFMLGIIIDLMLGSTLGIRALAFSILAYLVVLLCSLLQNMMLWLQTIIVLLLSIITKIIICGLQVLVINISLCPTIFLSSIIDGILWPLLFLLMRKLCYKFHVYQ